MPRIGGVDVPEYSLPNVEFTPPRPGYGELLAAAASDTIDQVRYGVPYAVRKATGNLTRDQEQNYQRNLGQPSMAAPAGLDDVTSGRVGLGRFIAENLVGSLPYMAGGLVGGVAGGLATRSPTGALAGAIAGGTPQFVGSNVDRAVAEEGGLSDQTAMRSLAVAPFQSAADAAIGRFLPGAGKILGEAAATQVGGFLARTAKSMIKAGATEAVTEAAQQAGERYAAGQPLGGADAVSEYVNAAVTAFAVGGVLGAGGGFRRADAVAKPIDQVTPDDMASYVDGMLSGDLRALPSPQMFGREPQGPEVSSGPTIPMENPTDFIVDSEGRVAPAGLEGERAIAIDRNLPQPSVEPPTLEEVQARADELAAAGLPVDAPFALRDPTLGGTQPVPDVQLPATPPIDPATGEEIPFDQHLEGLKKGLRGGFVQTVTATDEMDLMRKVYDQVFVEQDTRANTAKFAQRLGILDENMEPTELTKVLESERLAEVQAAVEPTTVIEPKKGARQSAAASQNTSGTAAVVTPTEVVGGGTTTATPAPRTETVQIEKSSAPVAPEVAAEMEAARKAAGIQRATTDRNLNTPEDVFNALADDDKVPASGEATRIEKWAQTLGLITKDDSRDVTPKGRQVYLRTADGGEAIKSAAKDQGYAGVQESVFEQGAKVVATGADPIAEFSSLDDFTAYQAGQIWARDFVSNGDGTKTAAQTNAIQARLLARKPDKTAARPAPATRVESAAKSPAEIQRRALNDLIDRADLSMAPDPEVVELRRMAAAGATPQQVGAAIQKLQGGGSIKLVPPRPAERRIEGTSGRGQPVFREMAQPASEPQKAQQRAETEGAVEAYRLRQLIEFARAEKGITDARAQVLHDLLDQGKVDRVGRMLKDFDPDAKPAKRLPRTPERLVESSAADLTGRADTKLEQAITGKDFNEVLDHMIAVAPSRFMREVMRNVKGLAERLQKAGYTLEIQVVQPGDKAPRVFLQPGARAYAQLFGGDQPGSKVWLKSSEVGASGVNYQLVAHEMVHAVSMQLLKYGNSKRADGKIAAATRDLYDLGNAVIDHFNARAKDKNLSDFEKRFLTREHNALSSVDEVLAWGLANPEMQRYLASIEYKPRQSVFGRLVELLRGLLGLDSNYNTALTELLRVSEQITDTPAEEIGAMLARNDPAALETGTAGASMFEGSAADASAANRRPEAANQATQAAAKVLAAAVENLDIKEMGASWRRKGLSWLSHNQLDRQYGQIMPGLLQHSDAHRERIAVRSRFEQMGDEAYQNFEKLEKVSPNKAKIVGEMMATSTEFQLDPNKTWEEHTHLQGDKNASALKVLHSKLLDMRDKLRRDGGEGWAVYNEFRALNEAQNYARMAAGLHSLVAMDPELTMGVADADINPVDQFMREPGLNTAQAARDRWSELLQKQIAGAVAFINAKKGEAEQGTDADMAAMRAHLSPIELQISAIHEALAGMQKAPYFHLGRYGDYFGSAVVRKVNGQADPAALAHIAKVLDEAGFDDVQISTDNTRPKIALRFDSLDRAAQFQKLMQGLGREGWLDTGWDQPNSSSAVKAGPRSRGDNFGVADGLPDFVQRYIQSIEASPTYVPDEGMDAQERMRLEKSKQDAVRLAIDTWLEQQPDSSISKVLVKRYTIPGYNKDMVRNFAHRWRVGSISLANVAAAPKFNQAFINMRAQVNDAVTSDVVEATRLNDIMSELKARDASNPINETADTFDKARAIAHAYFLGMSPAYGLINMTQLGVTALPELAKTHGFSKSFHAMRRASSTAIKILKAATNEAIALGPKHWADVAITETVLDKAGLSPAERNFALQMLATGTIDIGSAARALGQIAEDRVGSKLDIGLKYASALGMYTETFSRLTTALAARELHGSKEGAAQYATKVVSNAMFDYQSWNTARSLGKQGMLGPVTPIVTQFMSYSVQLTEKLYSEALDAFQRPRPGESAADAAERKAAARRFIGGHLVAVTTLAGSLGLPFATVFARVIEKMVDALGDDEEPFDATAAWRNFLADVLGPGMGEVVARGLPRALGFDISARAGEQNLLPFSEFLADRRPWKEALGSLLESKIGAVPSMASNVITGFGKISEGDLVGGMKDVMPVAFKGPIEVYRMTQDGYVDSKGNKMPISPEANSYLWQLLGFAPDERAEYQEARADQQARRGDISRRAEMLRKRIVKAVIDGDQERAAELIQEAQSFDEDNPAFAVVPSLSGALSRQMTARSRAQALQTPLGVSQRDVAGQSLTRYANTDYIQ